MKYICEIVELGKNSELPFSKKEPKDPMKQELLAEIDDQKLVALDSEISLLNKQGISAWDKPFKIDGRTNEVFVSNDRLLITTLTKEYHAWGFLGPAYLVNLKDGSLVTEVRGESGAALENGSFILGLEGYDYFNTWLYDKDGSLVQEWRSYGNYIVGKNDDIRVLEKDRRIPTKSRVVRLNLNGQIEKGPRLSESQISEPLILEDNSLIFIDGGVVRIVDYDLNERYQKTLMKIPQENTWRFHSNIQSTGNLITVNIYERTEEPPIEYTNHYWLIDLKC